jgi:predicted O-methyltransferase YrrM
MSKLKKLTKTLSILLKQPSLINYVLNADEVWLEEIMNQELGTTSLPVIQITDVIPNFDVTLENFTFLGGGSMPTDIMLLKGLASQIKDCSYFEIGTWRGESVINVAQVAKECFTLNLSKKEIIDLNLPEKYADLHGFFSKNIDNINHLYGDSTKFDFEGLNQKYDLIFIDGNHTFEYVKQDTANVFKHLMHEKTVIVWHDYAYTPEKLRPEVLAGILAGVPKNEHHNLYHVSNSMCAIYTKEKYPIVDFEPIQTPHIKFKVNAKASKI